MAKYGDIIAELRIRNRLTQEGLAKKLEISRAALSHYEKSRREPDYEILERMADFFDVSADYLLGRSSHPKLDAKRDMEVDQEVEELLKILETMPEEKRKEMEIRILAYARGLADANDD